MVGGSVGLVTPLSIVLLAFSLISRGVIVECHVFHHHHQPFVAFTKTELMRRFFFAALPLNNITVCQGRTNRFTATPSLRIGHADTTVEAK